MTFGERIKHRRKTLGLSAEEVAEKMGVSAATVYRYESSDILNMGIDKLELIAKALKTTPAAIMGWEEKTSNIPQFDNISPIKTKKFPLLGDIACGQPIFADEEHESYIEAGADIKADFCLKCQGDSMIGARIMPGDIVFIRQQDMVDNGEIAAVIIDDSATLKCVYYYPQHAKLVLQAENPTYEPLVYIGDELNYIRILGKAVAFQSNIR